MVFGRATTVWVGAGYALARSFFDAKNGRATEYGDQNQRCWAARFGVGPYVCATFAVHLHFWFCGSGYTSLFIGNKNHARIFQKCVLRARRSTGAEHKERLRRAVADILVAVSEESDIEAEPVPSSSSTCQPAPAVPGGTCRPSPFVPSGTGRSAPLVPSCTRQPAPPVPSGSICTDNTRFFTRTMDCLVCGKCEDVDIEIEDKFHCHVQAHPSHPSPLRLLRYLDNNAASCSWCRKRCSD